MFGITSFLPSTIGPPPKNVPPPTPIRLPQYNPQLPDSSETPSEAEVSRPSLVRFLQTLHRPTDIDDSPFAALGVHVHSDAPAEDLVPDPSYLPSASGWDDIDLDEARRRDSTFRRPLHNGNMSPEARVFLERRTELSIPNQAAFRTIRRIKPVPGKQPPRLGNCYEFYKQLDAMATFWDDTSMPPQPDGTDENKNEDGAPASSTPTSNGEAKVENTGNATAAAVSESNPDIPERVTYRTGVGASMPAEFRHNIVAAFIKLVAYDFGCNLFPPRQESRLHLREPPLPPPQSKPTSKSPRPAPDQKASYFPSGCVFVCRIPASRDAARRGIMYGPVAAVSARNTTKFATPAEVRLDFGRELVAALVTAQHRARENREEKPFGQGKWWATVKRWGGGEGGPIGREVEGDSSIVGDKDAVAGGSAESEEPDSSFSPTSTSPSTTSPGGAGSAKPGMPPPPAPIPGVGMMAMRGPGRAGPPAKKPRKSHQSVYDLYRALRPPSSHWDCKVRYGAIGRAPGAAHDDVFVISSLFHHISVLRVRVPARLLEVLDGAPEDGAGGARSWGALEVWRSRWFDLFLVDERVEAMRLLWGTMAWIMRENGEADRR